MKCIVFFLLPLRLLCALCESCAIELEYGRPYQIADHALRESRMRGLDCPLDCFRNFFWDTNYLKGCCEYSIYKSRFLHLIDWAEEDFSESAIRKTLHELGYETFSRPKGLPESFKANFSQKNFGMVYMIRKISTIMCVLCLQTQKAQIRGTTGLMCNVLKAVCL